MCVSKKIIGYALCFKGKKYSKVTGDRVVGEALECNLNG